MRSTQPEPHEENESGVVLVIFAIAMVVLVGMIALAIDGSLRVRSEPPGPERRRLRRLRRASSSPLDVLHGSSQPSTAADRGDRPAVGE